MPSVSYFRPPTSAVKLLTGGFQSQRFSETVPGRIKRVYLYDIIDRFIVFVQVPTQLWTTKKVGLAG